MTANDDKADPNQTPDDAARADRSRRRNPPIIELSADEVSVISTTTTGEPAPPFEPAVTEEPAVREEPAVAAAPEAAAGTPDSAPEAAAAGEPPADPGISAAAAEPPAAGGAVPPPPPPPPPAEPSAPRKSRGPGFAAIVATAVIAALVGGGVAVGGFTLLGIRKAASELEHATGQGNLAAALEARLKSLEEKAIAAGKGADQGRLGELSGLITQEREAVAGLESRVAGLGTQMQDLSARVSDTGPLDSLKSDLAAVKEQLGSDQQRIALLEPLAARVGAVETTDADLSHRISTLQATVEEVSRGLRSVAANSEAATAFALSSLERAVEDGGTFTAELALLSGRVGPEVTQPLEQAAVKGVPTRAAVEAGFARVEPAILATAQKPASDSYLDRLIASARSLVTIRPTGPVTGDGVVAVMSRLKAAVDAGDLASAAAAWQSLPADAKADSQGWADTLLTRVKTEEAVNALSDAVLKKLGTPAPASE